jgi:phage terminase large subunit-like protein
MYVRALFKLIFDKWNARQLINNLDKQTYITCVEFPQMMKFFSPILKEFVVMMHRKEMILKRCCLLASKILEK